MRFEEKVVGMEHVQSILQDLRLVTTCLFMLAALGDKIKFSRIASVRC